MHKSELLIEFLGSDGSIKLTNNRRFKSLLPLLRQLTQDCPERFTDPERLSVLHLGYIPTCKVCSGPSKMKRKQVWQEYCSTQCLHKDPDFRQKVSIAHKNRMSEQTYKKTKQTCLERYGVENPFQSEEVKKKIRQTNLERYGVKCPSQSEEIRAKVINTVAMKYGVENPLQSEQIRAKVKQTMMDRYGVSTNSQIHLSSIIHLIEDLDWWNQWGSFSEVKDFLSDWLSLSVIYKKAHQYRPDWDFRSSVSSPHQRVNALLDSLGIEYETNTKQIIAPLELDIHIPSHNLAIEVNGLYWHSELAGNKPKDYHLNKFLQCQAKGIRLLQFWDSEINNNWSTAELIIKGYLGFIEYSGVEVKEGTSIIRVDNRFPWDYSELGFTLLHQTEPKCWYTDYQNVYEEPNDKLDKIYDCGFSVFIYDK